MTDRIAGSLVWPGPASRSDQDGMAFSRPRKLSLTLLAHFPRTDGDSAKGSSLLAIQLCNPALRASFYRHSELPEFHLWILSAL